MIFFDTRSLDVVNQYRTSHLAPSILLKRGANSEEAESVIILDECCDKHVAPIVLDPDSNDEERDDAERDNEDQSGDSHLVPGNVLTTDTKTEDAKVAQDADNDDEEDDGAEGNGEEGEDPLSDGAAGDDKECQL